MKFKLLGLILAGSLVFSGCAVADPTVSESDLSALATAVGLETPDPGDENGWEPEEPVLPDSEVLAKALNKISRKSLTTGFAVLAPDGTVLAYRNDYGMVPASTMKLVTALAAIDVLGRDTRFSTSVVSAEAGKITLVGGGDPFLWKGKSSVSARRANLDDLAAATAAALTAAGVTSVKLTYDASLFSGSAYSSSWKKSWASYTPRIKALVVNGGKSTGWAADKDPALATAKAFADRLKKNGIKVSSTKAGAAPEGAVEVAAVQSATVGVQVRRMLKYSDNVAAEVLARQVAIAKGLPGSFSGANKALKAWMQEKGLWETGQKIDGGSGLSSKTKLKPSVLAKLVLISLDDNTYYDVIAGLPTAGVDGTLKKRFNDKSEAAGRKVVHAKTGSLKEVDTLAGYVTTADGVTLTFAFMSSHASSKAKAAVNWIDRSASVLAKCGCR
ncbi:MAG: D-alanyl-D-alanine carboxypeptidase/D-alanyl-D-alanine-endopeptidase [Propionibacteriaceae bacterium]|jgi:D-alanyl-D-alanine carboxypeptidase/D-alanyl-D-alanine-endopeptidase (penicillin-binding protein 4)|nr:D-alanyl-D-alanine carboxypeptidase/D-alanyl-D-alanine-endopeptidase [Propionibacteriaceae bacterium]